jgi:hypothetical protein
VTETALSIPERQSLDRYLPQSVKDLAWMANEVAKSGIYQNGNRALNGSECFVLMMKGAELGLTPMQSLNEISLIKGKPFVSKDVLTARILRSPRCKSWDPSDADAKHCSIVFEIRGDPKVYTLTTAIDDIPQRYFQPSPGGAPSNWTLIPEDMLFAWTVRRIARRWFPEALLDIGDGRQEPIDETKVIDVAKVEREVDFPAEGVDCVNCVRGKMFLHGATGGGTYLRCDVCGTTSSPPQDVRDAVRGTPEHLTLAGAAEPALEPGERTLTQQEEVEHALAGATIEAHETTHPRGSEPEPFLVTNTAPDAFGDVVLPDAASELTPAQILDAAGVTDANDSAVQSESERGTLGGEDVVAVPASAESAPIPEPDSPAVTNQAMRDAVYSHWILPRPTANKIEMRGLLEEFGWTGGETLGDWMLTLPEDKLAAIADAVAGIA